MDARGAHRKRCRRYDIDGHAHYLTFSCYQRQPFFRGRRSPRWFLESLSQARQECRFNLWAYVVMPDHVHLLIQPAPGAGISDILWRIKRRVTFEALSHLTQKSPKFIAEKMTEHGASGKITRRFWQRGGGYDRNIWTVTEAKEKMGYIHANPVRRGLVEHPSQWPWSSWRAWIEGTDEPLPVDRDSLPTL
ncbi:MAG: transposase [Planctomycetes bacterium]|nr:transposase [Planctomycetota bacterium]